MSRGLQRARPVFGALILALSSLGAAAIAPTQAWAAQHAVPSSGELYTFAFEDADIRQVAQEVLGATGTPYVIDPSVSGHISFRIEERLTREQLLAAFEAILRANGLTLTHDGPQLVVTTEAKAKGAPSVRRQGEGTPSSGYEVVAIPLSFAQPSEVAKALQAISPSTNVVYTNDKLNLLLLGGSSAETKTVMETIKIFDQDAFQDARIRWFELSQAQATTVATELERIVQASGAVGVTVVPLRRLNGLIVFGPSADALSAVAKWVARLDTTGKESVSSLWVYRPHGTSAEALARTLNTLLGFQNASDTTTTINSGGARSLSATSPVSSTTISSNSEQSSFAGEDQVRIGVDKDSNTLIVFASPSRWSQIQRILSEIDRTPKQVLIEASIAEVTLSKEFELGVDWSVMSKYLNVSSINSGSGTIAPSSPGLSVTYIDGNIQAALHALGSHTAVQVISAPKIIALDARTAHLQVGDQVPVITQSSTPAQNPGSAIVNSVDYRNTGVVLNVTPQVTGDDQVILDISQEVSSVAKTVTSGIDSPTIQQRHLESSLVMHDGGVVALGGLISSSTNYSDSGIPFLKDIPYAGSLFKTQSVGHDRSELIVLLTAHVIRDGISSDAAMKDLLSDMHELQNRGLLPVAKR
jgi:general secretion pathway protein D